MILGITGGTGCGKTTLLALIRELGGVVVDCDEVYHTLLRSDRAMLRGIAARFPGTVETGILNRKKLGELVFANAQALADLNRITHGAVKREVIRRLTPEPKLAAIDAIGLFESGMAELCKLTVAITAPKQARIARLMDRDGISESYAAARICAQHPQGWFQERCDYTLQNDGTPADFRYKCIAFLQELGIIET